MVKSFTYLNEDLSFPSPRLEARYPRTIDSSLFEEVGLENGGDSNTYIIVDDVLYKEHPLGFSIVTG